MSFIPSRLLRFAAAALALAGGGVALPMAAQLTVTTASADWAGLGLVTSATDAAYDMPRFAPAVDFVGDPDRLAFMAAVSGDTLYFRFRLNTPESSGSPTVLGSFTNMVAVGIDLDANGYADIAYAVNGQGNASGQSYFARYGESLGTPGDLVSLGAAYNGRSWDTTGADADFNYSLVSSIDGAVGDVAGSSGPNTLLTFSVSFSRLQDAIRALGGEYANYVVNAETALTFLFGGHSGTLPGSANVDHLAGGQIVPEASSLAFLALALAPLLLWRAGRRLLGR